MANTHITNFESAQKIAILEARRYNDMACSKRWKIVSMNSDGKWYADECQADKLMMHPCGFFMNPDGFDLLLDDVPKCENANILWEKSITEVY